MVPADPAAPLHKKLLLNEMHVLGVKLCSDLHALPLEAYADCDVQRVLARTLPLPFDEARVSRLTWAELVDLMTTVRSGTASCSPGTTPAATTAWSTTCASCSAS